MANLTAEQFKDAARKAYEAGDVATAKSLIARAKAVGASQTGIIDQAGSGVNEGLAGFLGAPVDALTGYINNMRPPEVTLGLGRDGTVTGADIQDRPPLIENPVGGSETFRSLLDPLISDTPPQTGAQRFARRAGQEVGFGVPSAGLFAASPLGAAARANMPAYMTASTAGDIGGAVGGQTAREIAPNSNMADIVGTLAGGMAGAGLTSMLMPKYGATPSLDDVKRQADDKWAPVKASTDELTDPATQRLKDQVRGSLSDPEVMADPNLHPRAYRSADIIDALDGPTIYGVEQKRRFVGKNVAGNADESGVGVAMKKQIDEYLNSLTPADLKSGDPSGVVDDLAAARKLTHRVKKAEAIVNKEMRGESRAATSGTGGNEVNAKKQNIRSLLDIERDPTLKGRKQGYTPDEVKQMERVVYGTPGSNIARLLGRLAPTSGALPMMATGIGGASGATAALMGGNPLLGVPALAGGVGIAAKQAAERMTKGEIEKLLKMVLNGGSLPASTAKSASVRAIVEQLLARPASQVQNQQ